jgi:molecular chaperone DnaK (HSP70)
LESSNFLEFFLLLAAYLPQIEVTFKVNINGILQVSAVNKGTGKAEITRTFDWMDGNPDASKDDLDNHRKEVEQI